MMIKVYLNQYRKYVNTRVKRILILTGMIAICTLSLMIGGTLTSSIVDVFLTGKTHILYAALIIYLLIESISVLVIFVLLKYIMSGSSDVLKVLNRLPIKPLVKYVSYYFFQIILEIFIPTIFAMLILIPRLVANGFELNFILKIVIVIILQALMISLLMNCIYNTLLLFAIKIKLPYPKNLILLMQIVLSIVVIYVSQKTMLLNMINSQGVKFKYDILYWHTGFLYRLLVSSHFVPSYLLLALVSATIVVGGILSFGLLTNQEGENDNRLLYQLAQPKTMFKNLVIKDLKLMIRYEDVVFLIVTSAIAMIALKFLPLDHIMYLNFLKIIFGLLGSLSLFSYGSELSYMLSYKRFGIVKQQYLSSKFVSCLILTLLVDTLFCLLSFGKLGLVSVLILYFTSLLSCFFSFIIGILFPFTKNSSINQIHLILSGLMLALPLNYMLKLINNWGSIEKIIVYLLLGLGMTLVANDKFKEEWNGELL